jgi:hypothetical protein
MNMSIALTAKQVGDMQTTFQLNGPNPNYAGMYAYIHRTFGSQMSSDQAYWFQQAAQVNGYLNGQAGYDVTPSA